MNNISGDNEYIQYDSNNYPSTLESNESYSSKNDIETKVIKFSTNNVIKQISFTINIKRIEERNRIREINKEIEMQL